MKRKVRTPGDQGRSSNRSSRQVSWFSARARLWHLLGARRLAVIAYLQVRVRELERENASLHARLAIPHDRKARRLLERTVRKAVVRAAAKSRSARG